jgi:hypothetical protein
LHVGLQLPGCLAEVGRISVGLPRRGDVAHELNVTNRPGDAPRPFRAAW